MTTWSSLTDRRQQVDGVDAIKLSLHATFRHATIPAGYRKLRPTYLPLAGSAETGPAR